MPNSTSTAEVEGRPRTASGIAPNKRLAVTQQYNYFSAIPPPLAGANNANELALGPDGNYWYASLSGGAYSIVSMTPSGTATAVAQLGLAEANSVLAGPDGQIWFGGTGPYPYTGAISKTTLTGEVSSAFWPTDLAPPSCANPVYAGASTDGLLSGPDGNVWAGVQKVFECSSGPPQTAEVIEKITPSFQFTEYLLPASVLGTGQLTTGPDGRIWFIEGENQDGMVSAITTNGARQDYKAPGAQNLIVTGPDNNLWYVSGYPHVPTLTKMNVKGKNLKTYYDPLSLIEAIDGLVVKDGALWTLSSSGSAPIDTISRVSVSGMWQDVSYDAALTGPDRGTEEGIIVGADGNLWFTNAYTPVGNYSPGVGEFQELITSEPDSVKTKIGKSANLRLSEPGYSGTWTVTPSDPSALTVSQGHTSSEFRLTGVKAEVLYVTIEDAYGNVQIVAVTVT